MYAEIKSTDKIIITRLNDSEKILLKEIVEAANSKQVTLKELTDENGDFGGCFIELTETPAE